MSDAITEPAMVRMAGWVGALSISRKNTRPKMPVVKKKASRICAQASMMSDFGCVGFTSLPLCQWAIAL